MFPWGQPAIPFLVTLYITWMRGETHFRGLPSLSTLWAPKSLAFVTKYVSFCCVGFTMDYVILWRFGSNLTMERFRNLLDTELVYGVMKIVFVALVILWGFLINIIFLQIILIEYFCKGRSSCFGDTKQKAHDVPVIEGTDYLIIN